MKGLFTVKVYTNISVFLKDIFLRLHDCLETASDGPVGYCDMYSDNEYSDDDDDGLISYKLDMYLPEKEKLLKGIFNVEYADSDEDYETESEGESEDESEGESKDGDSKEKVKDYKIANVDFEFDSDNEEDFSNGLKFIYDYKTSTYLEMKDIDISNEEKDMDTVKNIIDRLDNSIFTEKLFLNIELNNSGNKHDITNYLNKYYRSGNVILSKEFIDYIICDNSLDIELSDDYTIHLMDKDIQMITLENGKSIELYITKNKSDLDVLSYKIN